MVALVSSTTSTPNSKVLSRSTASEKNKRPPLLSSGNDNNGPYVSSRYLSSTVSTKDAATSSSSSLSSCSSSTTTTMSSPNSVCTPKKRFQPPLVQGKPTSMTKDCQKGVRHSGNVRTREMSTRSLPVSFQGESYALPVSKVVKPEKILERKKASVTPAARTSTRTRQGNFLSVSVDFTNEKMKSDGTASAVKALRKAIKTETKSDYKKLESLCDYDNSNYVRGGGGGRAIVVPARFWQETITLLRRVPSDPVSPPLLKSKKIISESTVFHGAPKRGSTMSNRVGSNNNLENTPSILSVSADARRGKVGEKKLVDAHMLRLLHNKHLQWRFANAKVDAAMVVQRATAKKSLYNAWVTISKLWHSVISKRVEMQQLKQNLKLHYVLKKQMLYLDKWDLTERDHSVSLTGAIVALESSSLCLPVLCGAKADIQNLKEAICSAVDAMQAMAVSLFSIVTKVEQVNSSASELASVMKTECFLLDQCKDMLSTVTLLEMEECSLQTHALQLIPPHTTTQR